MFFKGSRYAKVPETYAEAGGRRVRFKKIRLIGPAPAVQEHRVSQGERLDLIAHRYFRDPERFWRICDANLALWPNDLVVAPGPIAIPMPEE